MAGAGGSGLASLSGTQRGTEQQQQEEEEELGGATASQQCVNITNITDFVAVGAGGNTLDSRAMRNLLLLHLRKVNATELPELPDAALSADGDAPAAAAAAAGVGEAASKQMWSDIALTQRQQLKPAPAEQLQLPEGGGFGDVEVAEQQRPQAPQQRRRVAFASADDEAAAAAAPGPSDQAGAAPGAAATPAAAKRQQRSVRFAE